MKNGKKQLSLILASGSPRRSRMLKILRIPFKIVVSSYTESHDIHTRPHRIVLAHARGKAADVAGRITKGVVVGADTLVYRDGTVYGKPENYVDALRMLTELQGKTHYVYTGLALYDTGRGVWVEGYTRTKVDMRPLTLKEIEHYFTLINPLDKAGAYAIQDAGSMIIERISGCYYNVLGFPIAKLDEMLRLLGYSLFNTE